MLHQVFKQKYSKLTETRRFLLAIGIGMYALAYMEYLSVPRTHSGRWAWLLNWAIEAFGTYGVVYLWGTFGSILIVKALLWKNESY